MISATSEGKDRVEPWADELGAEYPIFCKAGGQFGKYSTGGVPTSYLIGPDGKVEFHGHPNKIKDSDVEDLLRKLEKSDRVSTWAFLITKALPVVPDALKDVKKNLEKMKFGAALKKVESTLERLEGEDREAGEEIQAWIVNHGATSMEKAAGYVRDNQIYKAYVLYGEVEDLFKGHDLAKEAKAAAKALKGDKAHGLEIKASDKLEKIKKDMREERKPEDKLKCLKPLLGKKYAETEAGKEAAKLAEELEQQAK